jgi:regulator of protease activity HflC (stomatin/prohibitin superfamily)
VADVTLVKPNLVRTVEVGFRTETENALPGPRAWSSQHGGDGIRRLADEAVLITGDGNLLEVQATIRYTVTQPRTFLFEVKEPLAVLRSAAEAVLREVAGARAFNDLLTGDRARFQAETLDRLRRRCSEYGLRGLGLELEGLALHDLHPPQEVVDAYHEVTKAMERRDRHVNVAEAAALARERRQQADSRRTVRQAEAAATEKVRLAEASRDAFLARCRARAGLSQEVVLLAGSLGGGTLAQAMKCCHKDDADASARQAAVTDFRLLWDALGEALAGRDKVVVDAEKVPGRRNLWFLPFDLLRQPALLGPERGGPRLRRGDAEEQ